MLIAFVQFRTLGSESNRVLLQDVSFSHIIFTCHCYSLVFPWISLTLSNIHL